MNKRTISLLLVFTLLLGAGLTLPALTAVASPTVPQAYLYTPTALPDGRILYHVQEGDTCIGVSLRMGVSIDQLVLLNGIRGDCTLIAGTDILIATVEPQPTDSGPAPTVTPLFPSPTPFAGYGEICVRLFDDLNGNARMEETEPAISGGAISLTDRSGQISETGITESSPVCFRELPEGDYSISMGVPDGYNPTTRTSYNLEVRAGDQSVVDFGAQISAAAQPLPPSEGGRSPVMGLLGGLVLVLGVGLAVYARFIYRK